MKPILVLSLILIATASAMADVTLVQDTLLNGVSTRTTMWVKGDKVRTDNDTTSSIIMDTATGDMTTLMHEQKMKVVVNAAQLRALAAGQAPGGGEAAPLPETKLTATGEKETVDGYECEIYLSENQGMTVKLWIAKDYPGEKALREQLKVLAKLAAAGAPKQPEVPGIALKTEFEQQGLKFTTRLVSLSSDPVSDDKFVVPADYQAP